MQKLPKAYLKSVSIVQENQKIQQEELTTKLREFNPMAPAFQDFDNLDLYDIEAIKLSDSGSRGVVFIETARGILVVKLSGEVGVDKFLNQLSIEYGVSSPRMKVLRWDQEEMTRVVQQIIKAIRSDEILTYRIKGKLKVAFLEIIEYIPGIPLYLFREDRAKIAFNEKRLDTLGRIYAFDIFINNGDRYPLNIWRSPGNYENIILKVVQPTTANAVYNIKDLSVEFDNFYAIDPTMVLKSANNLVQQEIFTTYIKNVGQFLKDCIQDIKNKTALSLKKLNMFVFNHIHYDLSDNDLRFVILGILKQIKIIHSFGIHKFDQIIEQTIIPLDQDWTNNYNQNLERIDRDFHNELILVFEVIINENADIFYYL